LKKLPYVFEEKETDQSNNNWDGTGLGLSICAFICEKLGWNIRYYSNASLNTQDGSEGE